MFETSTNILFIVLQLTVSRYKDLLASKITFMYYETWRRLVLKRPGFLAWSGLVGHVTLAARSGSAVRSLNWHGKCWKTVVLTENTPFIAILWLTYWAIFRVQRSTKCRMKGRWYSASCWSQVMASTVCYSRGWQFRFLVSGAEHLGFSDLWCFAVHILLVLGSSLCFADLWRWGEQKGRGVRWRSKIEKG